MERLKKAAIITRLIERLRASGSWCGETHIQKAMLFLQDMLRVPTRWDFVLYRHGPFSFDLRDELTALRGDGILRLEPQYPPYGPKIGTTERAGYVEGLFEKTLAEYEPQIAFVADRLGAKGVTELERLATAYWVTKENPGMSVVDRALGVTELKPHIDRDEAEAAVAEVDRMNDEAQGLAGRSSAANE
jgi:hypothetical protein